LCCTLFGNEIRASVEDSVVVNRRTVIPRGADAIVRLPDRKRGHFTLGLLRVKAANDRVYGLNTDTVIWVCGGGGAGIGAITWALASGQKLIQGPRVWSPSEAVITFTLWRRIPL
jgi:hypothetical protein